MTFFTITYAMRATHNVTIMAESEASAVACLIYQIGRNVEILAVDEFCCLAALEGDDDVRGHDDGCENIDGAPATREEATDGWNDPDHGPQSIRRFTQSVARMG
jgi:hypothetical protein